MFYIDQRTEIRTFEHFYDRPMYLILTQSHCFKSPLIKYDLHFIDGETAQKGDDLFEARDW